MAGNQPSASAAEERELNGLINDAVRDTEAEIFTDALGTDELDNDGDTSLEQMGEGLEGDDLDEEETNEAVDEEATDEEEVPLAAQAENAEDANAEPVGEEQPRQDDRRGNIPPAVLRESNNRARAAEAEAEGLRQQMRSLAERFDALQAGLQAPRSHPQPQAQQQPERPPEPDVFSDPDGWKAWNRAEAERIARETFQHGMQQLQMHQQQQFQQAVDANLAQHANGPRGYEFQAAYSALTAQNPRDPHAQMTVRRILNSPDPGDAMFQWWDANGGQEYRAQLRENLIAQIRQLEDPTGAQRPQRQVPSQQSRQATQSNQPRQVFRGPVRPEQIPSLNEARGSNSPNVGDPELYDGSEASIWEHATRR